MSASEIKQSLRKLDFPHCAREALFRIEKLCSKSSSKQLDLQLDLMSEFVFGELERRRRKRPTNPSYPSSYSSSSSSSSSSILELQLIELLCEFFDSPGGSAAVRNAIFLSLYPAEQLGTRQRVLNNLVSLTIATQNRAVLNAAGIWLQQLGPTSQQSVALARHVLEDYLALLPDALERLRPLPGLVPYFTANLLTAVGEVYKEECPPMELLRLVGEWIGDSPGLLVTTLTDNPALPMGGIPMIPVTPIAGLFRWCILSPIRPPPDATDQAERQKFYSKIQQLLMESVLRLKSSDSNKHAISAQHLAATTRVVASTIHSDSTLDETSKNLSMERLAQAVSAAMSANCIYGNKQELIALLQPLSRMHFLIEWTLQSYASKAA